MMLVRSFVSYVKVYIVHRCVLAVFLFCLFGFFFVGFFLGGVACRGRAVTRTRNSPSSGVSDQQCGSSPGHMCS